MKVALFTLGGTIASTHAPSPAEDGRAARGVAPGLNGADLVAAVPGLDAAGADLEVHDILRVPGASLTIPDVIALVPAIGAGFGAGHVPAGLADRLGALAARIPVVIASRAGAGLVLARTYSYPGSERDLRGRGLIGAGLLDPLKARILFHVMLAGGAGREQIATAFRAIGAGTGRPAEATTSHPAGPALSTAPPGGGGCLPRLPRFPRVLGFPVLPGAQGTMVRPLSADRRWARGRTARRKSSAE